MRRRAVNGRASNIQSIAHFLPDHTSFRLCEMTITGYAFLWHQVGRWRKMTEFGGLKRKMEPDTSREEERQD